MAWPRVSAGSNPGQPDLAARLDPEPIAEAVSGIADTSGYVRRFGRRTGFVPGARLECEPHQTGASHDHDSIGTQPHPILLAGRWVESPDVLTVSNPADPTHPAGQTYHATAEQYETAVSAAVAAFEQTRQLPAYERGAILRTISAGIKARREELGRLIALEAGKPIRDALVEVDRAMLDLPARCRGGRAARRRGDPARPDGHLTWPPRPHPALPDRPVAAISPFNFPLNLAAHKLAPAIAAGCSIVLKPPSKDPLTMLTVGEIIAEAGLPEGAVSILPMTRELGDRMVADERFKLLTFTGSPSVGWRMKERAGKKKVVLELGGNAGVIVDKTRRPRLGRRRCLAGAFGYAGQVCISVQRMIIHEDIWDDFMEPLRGRGRSAAAGRPARSRDRPWADGRRARRRSDPALGRRGRRPRWQAVASAATPTGLVLPADDPDRHSGDGRGLLERGVRPARRRLPVPDLR